MTTNSVLDLNQNGGSLTGDTTGAGNIGVDPISTHTLA